MNSEKFFWKAILIFFLDRLFSPSLRCDFMALTKAAATKPPSANELSDLAKKIRELKTASAAPKRSADGDGAPKAKKTKTVKELITEEDLLIADTFDPRELNFVLSWANFDKLNVFSKVSVFMFFMGFSCPGSVFSWSFHAFSRGKTVFVL